MPKVHLELTLEQAAAVVQALDLYSRLCIGQIDEVAHLVSSGAIPPYVEHGNAPANADMQTVDAVRELMLCAKKSLGFHPNASRGIGHAHNPIAASRSYEVKKALARALAIHRNPNPSFQSVDYDGLIVRYTSDPEPRAAVVDESLA